MKILNIVLGCNKKLKKPKPTILNIRYDSLMDAHKITCASKESIYGETLNPSPPWRFMLNVCDYLQREANKEFNKLFRGSV